MTKLQELSLLAKVFAEGLNTAAYHEKYYTPEQLEVTLTNTKTYLEKMNSKMREVNEFYDN